MSVSKAAPPRVTSALTTVLTGKRTSYRAYGDTSANEWTNVGRTRFSQGDYSSRANGGGFKVSYASRRRRPSIKRPLPSLHSDPPLDSPWRSRASRLPSERSRDPVLRERALSRVTADIRHPARLNARRRASDATLRAFALTRKIQLLRIWANNPFSWTLIEVNYDLTGSPSVEKQNAILLSINVDAK